MTVGATRKSQLSGVLSLTGGSTVLILFATNIIANDELEPKIQIVSQRPLNRYTVPGFTDLIITR